MKRICLLFLSFIYCGSFAQNHNNVYPKYNSNSRIILIQEKKETLADVIMQQERLNILRKQQKNENNYHKVVKRDTKRESKEIRIDYKDNRSSILDLFDLLNIDLNKDVDQKVFLLDQKNGFKDIVLGSNKSSFGDLQSIDNSSYIYNPSNKGLYSVFDIKSMDRIYLQFGNENRLDNISLIKNYLIYKSKGGLEIALFDFKSLITNYRQLLGVELYNNINEDKDESMFVWESNNVRLIVVGGYDKRLKLKSDLGNEYYPYFTTKIYYYKKNSIEEGI